MISSSCLLACVARERDGVEAGAADGTVAEQGVEREAAFAPTLREARIFQNGQHQAVVSGLLHLNVANGRGDGGGASERCRERRRACAVNVSRAAPIETFFMGAGERIDAHVGPAGILVYATGEFLNIPRFPCPSASINRWRAVAKSGAPWKAASDRVGGFERDGELIGRSRCGRKRGKRE